MTGSTAQPRKTVALLAGTLPPLAQEDISRGVRLEVWDDVSREWHSLHQRLLTVDVEAAGEVLSRAPDAGFLQGAALTKSDTAPNGPKYAHEVVAGWDGWSLSAPRPGKVVVHDKGKEEVLDAPPPDPAPANPIESRSEVAPRTLPRLRYGRRYAMRAYAVDLAGNSRPHDVSGAPPREDQPLPPPQPAPPVRATTSAQPDVAHSTEANAGRKETGCEPPHHEDIVALVARRQASKVADALTPPVASGRAALEISALKEMLSAKRGAPSIGPEADKGVAGFDPAGFAATKVEAVDRFVAARLVQKAAAGDASISRAQQVERAFHEAANKASALFERTDLQTSANVAGLALSTALAQQHGLAVGMDASALGKLAQRLADVITTTRPFLRWDALLEPTVVPRFEYTEGESLLRMVIRSGVTQAPADLAITITPPDEYATAVKTAWPELGLAWRADSQRHIAPPKTSQFRAELHGAFDEAMGAAAPANAVAAALGVALREAGSFLDTTVADIHNPGKRLPQPGVTFHVTRTADDPAVKDPGDLPHGDPLSPGQYVAHDVDRVVLPYLPDPIARGISLMFPDAGKAHHLAGLFALEGTTLDYLGAWSELVPFRLVLESGPELGAVVEEHVVRVTLPPGEQLRLRLASTVRREKLDLLGLWASLPTVIRDNSFLREVAADGWFWWLTPSAEMRLVHAVPKPLEAPRPTILVPVRPKKGDTAVALVGGIDLHGPSTDRIDIEASWTQWVDDVTKPGPEKVSGKALACGTAVDPDEDLVVLGLADEIFPLPGGGTLRVHGAVHQTGDTLHRKIDYRVRATTRFREYFHPQLVPSPDDLSVIGPVRTLNVPSSARPAKVIVRDVLPLFRWSEETEPGDPFARRRTRKAGLRLYLERPWYSTGDDELLGVVLAAGADALVSDTVSQWGADPVFRQQGPGARSILPLSDLLHLTGVDDRLEAARPVALPALLPLVDKQELAERLGARLPTGVFGRARTLVRGYRVRSRNGFLALCKARRGPISAEFPARAVPRTCDAVRLRATGARTDGYARPHRRNACAHRRYRPRRSSARGAGVLRGAHAARFPWSCGAEPPYARAARTLRSFSRHRSRLDDSWAVGPADPRRRRSRIFLGRRTAAATGVAAAHARRRRGVAGHCGGVGIAAGRLRGRRHRRLAAPHHLRRSPVAVAGFPANGLGFCVVRTRLICGRPRRSKDFF